MYLSVKIWQEEHGNYKKGGSLRVLTGDTKDQMGDPRRPLGALESVYLSLRIFKNEFNVFNKLTF